MYLVYILKSDDSKYYIGMTNNFLKRWMQHNKYIKGGAKYTSKNTHWTPICIIDGFKNKSEAMKCEWVLKTRRTKLSKKFKGVFGRILYLNELLKKTKWTSTSDKIINQNLNIYIINLYKPYLDINTHELEWF